MDFHTWFWRTGGHIFLVTFVSNFLCFLPIARNFYGIGCIEDANAIDKLLHVMDSTTWQFALVANIAVGVPVMLDFVLDIVHEKMSGSKSTGTGMVPLIVLIYSLIVPNILTLVVAIPNRNIELVFCFMFHRLLCLYYGVFGHLWNYGEDSFKTAGFLFAHICFSMGLLCFAYDSISPKEVTYLYWMAVAFVSIAIVRMIIFTVQFVIHTRKIGFKKLSLSQISCLIYLRIFALLGLGSFCLSLLYRGNYDVKFMSSFTYMEAGFTVLLTAARGRLVRAEIINKEVRISYLIYVNLFCAVLYNAIAQKMFCF